MLVWTCHICGKPVADEEGCILVRTKDMNDYRNDPARKEPGPSGFVIYNAAEMMDLRSPAPWVAEHYDCCEGCGAYYEFDVARIRTLTQVIDWTAHLMQKNWLEETDWPRLLRKVHKQTGETEA